MGGHRGERNRRDDHAGPVDDSCGHGGVHDRHGNWSECKLRRGAGKDDRQRHEAALFSRTPRPPLWLVVLSEMSSMPSASSAATSFISESTLPRITSSLASMRWMVGSERPANSASLR